MKLYPFATLLLIFLITTSPVFSQLYSWEKGDKMAAQYGTYGTQGVPNVANNPGGRKNMGSWRDNDGNLWIFGGDQTIYNTSQDYKNDLCKYDLANQQWTWVKGSSYNTNDNGIYGQLGVSNMANTPGARKGPATWTDYSGKLWLFGGYGFGFSGSYNSLSDLWKYDPITNIWIWMKGSASPYQLGVYGTKGVFDAANMPGSRTESYSWIDGKGKLWLFGGEGRDANGTFCRLSDLWCYDPLINQWAWMAGNKINTYFGIYGTKGVPSTTVFPGGRFAGGSWADTTAGDLYLFAGYGYGDMYDIGGKYLNDLWRYHISTGEWTWLKGSTTSSQPSAYGSVGVGNFATGPGGRYGFSSAKDPSGAFWLFGGIQDGQGSAPILLRDLWKYDPVTNFWTWYGGTYAGNQLGIYGTQGVPASTNSPGARYYSTSWCDVAGNFYIFGGNGNAESTNGYLSDLWKYGNCKQGSFVVNGSNPLICAGETATLTVNTPREVFWSTSEITRAILVSPTVTTSYSVNIPNVEGCNFTAVYTQTVSECTALPETKMQETDLNLFPNPSDGSISIISRGAFKGTQLVLRNVTGQLVFEQILQMPEQTINCKLPAGLYYYEVRSNNNFLKSGKLIIH